MTDVDQLIIEAAKRLKCHAYEVEWYSWPETFASTSGPRGGIGGQAISTFQVYGFTNGVTYLKACAGFWKPWDGVMGSPWNTPGKEKP